MYLISEMVELGMNDNAYKYIENHSCLLTFQWPNIYAVHICLYKIMLERTRKSIKFESKKNQTIFIRL